MLKFSDIQKGETPFQHKLTDENTRSDINTILSTLDPYIISSVRNMALDHPGIRSESDDIIQNVRIKYWLALTKYHIDNHKAYIQRIIQNEVIDTFRRRSHVQMLELPLLFNDHGECNISIADPGEGMGEPSVIVEQERHRAQVISNLIMAVLSLPPKQKDAMLYSLKRLSLENFEIEQQLIRHGIKIDVTDESLPKTGKEKSRQISLISLVKRRLYLEVNYDPNITEWFIKSFDSKEPIQPSSAKQRKFNTEPVIKSKESFSSKEQTTSKVQFLDLLPHLGMLEEPYQTSVRLHHCEHLSYVEMQAHLDKPIGTIKAHVSRGLAILREIARLDQGGSAIPGTLQERRSAHRLPPEKLQRIADLADPYHTTMHLFYIEHFSDVQIAEHLHVPVGTIKARLHRGRKLLNNSL